MTFDLTTKNWQLPSSYVKTNNSPCGLWEIPNKVNWLVDGGEVVLLINQAGAVGSSTFIDTAKNHPITSVNAAWSANATLFGKPTIHRVGGFLKIVDIADLNFMLGQPFCIELFYKFNATGSPAGGNNIIHRGADNGSDVFTSPLNVYCYNNAFEHRGLWVGIGVVAANGNNWTHLAWTRDGNSIIRFFMNGIKIREAKNTAALDTLSPLLIGSSASTSSDYFAEIRIVRGVPVYTENFTPPSAGFV